MNDSWDAIEDRLRRLRPRSVSSATRQRVAKRIAATRTRRLLATSSGCLAAALSAGLLAAMFVRTGSRSPELHSENRDVVSAEHDRVHLPDTTASTGRPAPTLWAYRRAAEESWEEFDSLLGHHAEKLLRTEQESITSLRSRFP